MNLVESLYDCGVTAERRSRSPPRVSGRATSSGWPTCTATTSGSMGRLRLRSRALGPGSDGRRRPSRACRPVGAPSSTVRQHAGVVRRGRQIRRRRRRSRQGVRTPRRDLGRPVHWPDPCCRSGTRAVAPSTAGSAGAGRTRHRLDGPNRGLGSDDASLPRRRLGGRRPGRSRPSDARDAAGSDDARARLARLAARLDELDARSRAPAAVASWPPTG